MTPNLHLWLIPILPLIGAAINGFFGKRLSRQAVTAVAWTFCGAAFAYALWVVMQFLGAGAQPYSQVAAHWIRISDFQADFGFYLDRLSMVMLLVVTGVGFLIHIYSAGYMWDDPSYYRFFSYLNLFMFFMLTLILANNYLVMFIGWEGVGLASYLLIGFWFTKDSAASAGKKAFIVNRIGDFGFLIALFLLIKHFGSLNFEQLATSIAPLGVETAGVGLLTSIGMLLMVGAAGKSAQIPLYVWLPDAMEGPTPVSALIHAATMVTAGVYMVARSHVIFDRAPSALLLVAIIGTLTALFAATIGITQTDIKKVLAYSTVSQLGYMFMGCGVAAYSAGIFHLMTHAFFKGLLFLGAGSVIHAVGGEQDMRKMGGLRTRIPWTFWTVTAGTFAIAGIPPLAGFFSKDEILWQAYSSPYGSWVFWLIGVITAFITSFYMFRLWFITFFGEYRGEEAEHKHSSSDVRDDPHGKASGAMRDDPHGTMRDDPHGSAAMRDDPHGHKHAPGHGHGHGGVHESPKVMLIPLVLLAILSVCGGWVGYHNKFENFLAPVFRSGQPAAQEQASAAGESAQSATQSTESHAEEGGRETLLMGISILAAVAGFLLAWQMYHRNPRLPQQIAASLGSLYNAVLNKYYVDEIYAAVLVKPLILGSSMVLWHGIDQGVIDATLDNSATGAREVSDTVRHMQSGNIRSYAGWVAVGAAGVIAYMIWLGTR